ncbi:hypothetical protein [Streptococcus halichoeri]|uniref:hypothetical protein n=1 Tax=Streptococcus halichoeri TaxID=254785 RepID=UPI000DB5C47C|nr:hypothetical protein [Streptococcus halichoeri]PZO94666.1 MAG: hypothetical protein DI617_05885 [Streptococcus pyogenes]
MTFEEIRDLVSYLETLGVHEFSLKTEKIDLIFKKNHPVEEQLRITVNQNDEQMSQVNHLTQDEHLFRGTILEFEDWET